MCCDNTIQEPVTFKKCQSKNNLHIIFLLILGNIMSTHKDIEKKESESPQVSTHTGSQQETINQELIDYLKSHFCIPAVYCNPDITNYTDIQQYCYENVPGLSSAEISRDCENWNVSECDSKMCKVQITDYVLGEDIVTANFDDVIVRIPGSNYWLRLPALYPRDCSNQTDNPYSIYAKCPCCYCSDRGTVGIGFPEGTTTPSHPTSDLCLLQKSGAFFLYFPKEFQRLHTLSFLPDIVSVDTEATGFYDVDINKIITITDWGAWSAQKLLEIGKQNPELIYGLKKLEAQFFPSYVESQRRASHHKDTTSLKSGSDDLDDPGPDSQVDFVPFLIFAVFIMVLFYIIFTKRKKV